MVRFRVIIFFLSVCSIAPGQSVQKWKMNYDSAQFFWKADLVKSIKFLQEAERIAINDIGIYDENYLAIISDLGLAYAQKKDFKKAEEYLKKNLLIETEISSPETPRVLKSVCNLAILTFKSGDFSRAEKMFKDILLQSQDEDETYQVAVESLTHIYESSEQFDSALLVVRKALSQSSSDTSVLAAYQFNLAEGRILRKKKNYRQATQVLRLLNGKISTISPARPFLLNTIKIELSMIDIEMGLYGKAEKELLLVYQSLKTMPGDDGTLFTVATNGLAYVYEKLGVYDKALLYYQESFDRSALINGRTSFGCVVIQSNIAGIYLKQGQIKEAIGAYESFIGSIQQLSKMNQTVYLIALNNLATAYRQNDQYELALQYFGEVYDRLEKKGLLQDDLTATVLNNLAVTYTLQGEYVKAIDYFEKALMIKESLFGSGSPANLDMIGNLAVAYWVMKRYDAALPLFQKSLALALKEVKYIFPSLTEVEQVQFYQKQKENFERFNTLAVQSASLQPDFLVQMFNNQLLLKSLVFFTHKNRVSQLNGKGQEHLKVAIELAQTKGEQLGHLYQMPLKELESLGLSIPALELELDGLEKLIRASMQSPSLLEPEIAWKDIHSSLKPQEALVDIIRFRKYDVLPSQSTTTAQRIRIGFTDSIFYAILITSPETLDYPKLVLLKNGNLLENRNLSYYRNTLKFDVDDGLSYAEYWKPFEPYIQGKKKIYVSPDGVYHQINVNAIRDEKGKYILEKYDVYALLNSVQFKNRKENNPIELTKIVLMGDPFFGSQKTYNPLPATRDEVHGIASILQNKTTAIKIFVGEEASEGNLKTIKSPSILHIATHGFYTADFVYVNENVKNDYLFHSGLLLSDKASATANLTSAFDSDGIVSAYEVMGLDLSNTQLVVLSACETGLGKIEIGEGVYGLQRSFLQAGASNILTSLWKVEDVATKDLMIKFYSYLNLRYDRHQAFKRAQLDMLHQHRNPRLWGGFVMISNN